MLEKENRIVTLHNGIETLFCQPSKTNARDGHHNLKDRLIIKNIVIIISQRIPNALLPPYHPEFSVEFIFLFICSQKISDASELLLHDELELRHVNLSVCF